MRALLTVTALLALATACSRPAPPDGPTPARAASSTPPLPTSAAGAPATAPSADPGAPASAPSPASAPAASAPASAPAIRPPTGPFYIELDRDAVAGWRACEGEVDRGGRSAARRGETAARRPPGRRPAVDPVRGLPAVSADSARVAVPRATPGPTGLDFSVDVLAVETGEVVQSLPFVSRAEMKACDTTKPETVPDLAARGDAIVAALSGFTPLTALAADEAAGEDDAGEPRAYAGAGIAATLADGGVSVTFERAGAWSLPAKPQPVAPRDRKACGFKAYAPRLGGVYVDGTAAFALVELAYAGTDLCWEPASTWVVARPR